MKISPLRLLVVLFWFAMTGWLVRYEAFPRWFTSDSGGYRTLFEGRPFILDSWMQITFKGSPIGYSHTWMDSDVRPNSESHTILNKTVLSLNMLGEPQTMNVLSRTSLDESYVIQEFSTVLNSESYKTRVEGRRIGGDNFEVTVSTPASVNRSTLRIPDNCMIYSPASEMAVRGLKPGDALRLRALDPVSMSVSEVVAEALRREEIPHDGRMVDATVLKISCMGLDMLSWVDAEGRVLRHETPFGWVMTACSADEILAASAAPKAMDMLSSVAVPCAGEVADPRSRGSLTILFKGIPFEAESLAGPRQIVEPAAGGLKMTVLAQPLPSRLLARGDALPGQCLPFLAPSPSIQSDHPKIIAAATAITKHSADLFEAAKAISAWIHANIQMQPTISLPSALDVLAQRVGDCNEITHLFVALARAVGIPARVHVGLVYGSVDGPSAFYYHAWPSVYVGEWVEMDPTWGQTTVDATHVSLATGELADQLKILPMLGQARAEIPGENAP